MSKVRVINRKLIYKGRAVDLISEIIKIKEKRMMRETVVHPGAVVIVPILAKSRMVLVRQYRHAVKRNLLELPAGTLSPGESPRACAMRELEEETGYRAKKLTRLGFFYTAPGVLSEKMTMYIAQDLYYVGAHPDNDEDIEVIELPISKIISKFRSGGIPDAKTMIGLFMLEDFLSHKGK